MSDTIKIQVTQERMPCSHPAQNSIPIPAITITKDLARQIVALGHMAQTEAMIRQYQMPGMPPGMIAVDAGLTPATTPVDNGDPESYIGKALRLAQEKAATPVDADHMPDCYGNFHAGKSKSRECVLCTEIDACKRKTATPSTTTTPVDAGGEDAAVESIRLAMGTKAWDSYVDYAGNVVQLIRAGKVPGVHFNEGNGCCVSESFHNQIVIQSNGKSAEIAALRARLADAERRADEMEGKAGEWIAVDIHKQRLDEVGRKNQSLLCKNCDLQYKLKAAEDENSRVLGLWDDVRGQYEDVKMERDRALERVAELELRDVELVKSAQNAQAMVLKLNNTRLADLAAYDAGRKSNPKADVAPASGAHVQRVVGCEQSTGENI